MGTCLQESGGLRRTAPVQSPVPVGRSRGLSLPQRLVVGAFVLILAMGYAVQLLPAFTGGVGGSQPGEVTGTP